MKIGEKATFEVYLDSRLDSPSFDIACFKARKRGIQILGITDDGHSTNVKDWDRTTCDMLIEFVGLTMTGSGYTYEFSVMAVKSEQI